jgi:hypothetical protein
MDRQKVGAAAHVDDRLEQLDPHLGSPTGGNVRVVGDYAHAERACALGDECPDPAESDNPECLAVDLDPLPPLAFPLTVHQG